MARKSSREFSPKTIELLERRAGHKCSNPNCLALTSGASGNAYTKIGQAAHINAAGSSGPRFDETLSDEYISSQENGIWLCCNCHIKVDNPRTNKYTVELLKEWKRNREIEAEFEVGRPKVKDTELNIENRVVVKKLDNIEKNISQIMKSSIDFDNYGFKKEIFDYFEELDNYLMSRVLYKEKKHKSQSEINDYMIEIFEWLIGNRNFPTIELTQLYKKFDESLLDGNIEIIRIKQKALINYFDGQLKKVKLKYDILYRRCDGIHEKWLRDDILIDGRNLLSKIEFKKGKCLKKNKFDEKIREIGYNIQYPYIDRLEKEILNNTIEKTGSYKYKRRGTQIYGVGLQQLFLNIQKVIYIAILYGSYTQILSLRKFIGNVLILYGERLDDGYLYKIGLKFYSLAGNYTEFMKISDKASFKHRFLESYEFLNEILKIRKSILIYNVDYFDIFIYEYFGRLLNEKQYIQFENKMLKILKGNNIMLINSVLKSIPNNIVRLNKIDEIFTVLNKKSNAFSYRRQIQTILNYINYGELLESTRFIIKSIIQQIISNKDYIIITNLLIQIKNIEKNTEYDEVLLKKGSEENLIFKIQETAEYKPEYLELIVDEITDRNTKTINTKIITSYTTTYNMASNFYETDSLELRKIIEKKIFPLVDFSVSSPYIEVEEKIKLLRNLVYIYFFDKKYEKRIKKILKNINLESSSSSFSTHTSSKYIVLYMDVFKYVFNEITLDELLNNYFMKIIENNDLFLEIGTIIEYLSTKVRFTEMNLNIVFMIINLMLNLDDEDNRICAIKLSKLLYQSKYFASLFDKLLDISKNSNYNVTKAVAILIKELNNVKDEQIKELTNNILNNKDYNIRYIGGKYLSI